MDEKLTLVSNWLIKAQHDLEAAKRLAQEPDALLDNASCVFSVSVLSLFQRFSASNAGVVSKG